MGVSRRNLLVGTGVSAAAAAFAPAFEQAAQAAPTLTGKDLETLRSRWVDLLTGRHLIVASPATFKNAISALDRRVDGLIARIKPTDTRYFDNCDWSVDARDVDKTNKMRMNYVNLQAMAVAWATPGSKHQGSTTVLNHVLAGLEHMNTKIYSEAATPKQWGNWWAWNIGATRPLADIMAILHSQLEQEAIDRYCAAIDYFQPERNPIYESSGSGKTVSKGANRVDICRALIVRSIVQPDTDLLRASVEALIPTWQYVTEGDGFFADGSFVQHSTIGYTGTYGLVLLNGLSLLFALLANTAFDVTDPTRDQLTGFIENAFAPFMYQGQMMDAVRGRAISRANERSMDNGNQLIDFTLRLAGAVDAETAKRWRGLCKWWIEQNSASTILQSTDILRLALVTDLMNSSVSAVAEKPGSRMFPAMDRLVHRGVNSDWAVCIAMCSNRIAWSESSEKENIFGVKTSQGMTYLYLGSDDMHFDDNYWPTSNLEAPVGTTVDMTPLGMSAEGDWGKRLPANEWTGGAVLGDRGVAAMHLIGPGGTGLKARKFWLTLPDRVVALGADISTGTQEAVRSIVEHRNLGETGRRLVVAGSDNNQLPVDTERDYVDLSWAHLEGVGGYLFLDDTNHIRASVAPRTGAWGDISLDQPAGYNVKHTRYYATISYEHGLGAQGSGIRSRAAVPAAAPSYAYVLLPLASQEQTQAAAGAQGDVKVITNDAHSQSVVFGEDTLAVAFWEASVINDAIGADRPALWLSRDVENKAEVSVSDPTQKADQLVFTLSKYPVARVTGADADRVSVKAIDGGSELTVDVSGRAGMSVVFTLEQAVVPAPEGDSSAKPSVGPMPYPSASASSQPAPAQPSVAVSVKPHVRPGLPKTGI